MIKRVTALLMALLLVLPVTGFADEVDVTEAPIEPTEVTTSPTEVIEEEEDTAVLDTLQDILTYSAASAEYLRMTTGCVVFLIVVVLCFFAYKFFRIFF